MKPRLTDTEFYNWWLRKYHNTSIQEICEKEPELAKSGEWYKKYAVTQEQHDAWYEWAVQRIAKYYAWSKPRAKKEFTFTYINVSPTVIESR